MKRLMREREVLARLNCSRSTIYRWRKAGHFPAPLSLGENSVAWLESEVDTWIEQRPRLARKPVKQP